MRACAPRRVRELGVVEDAADGGGEAGEVPTATSSPVRSCSIASGTLPDRGGDDGDLGDHRVEDRRAGGPRGGGEDEGVPAAQPGAGVGGPAREARAIGDPELGGERGEVGRSGPSPTISSSTAGEQRERAQEVVEPLDGSRRAIVPIRPVRSSRRRLERLDADRDRADGAGGQPREALDVAGRPARRPRRGRRARRAGGLSRRMHSLSNGRGSGRGPPRVPGHGEASSFSCGWPTASGG